MSQNTQTLSSHEMQLIAQAEGVSDVPQEASSPSPQKSPQTESLRTRRVGSGNKRIKLKSHEKHPVILRDQGQCTFVDASGRRCPNDRWLHLHHIIPVSQGGSNSPENLTTLCSSCHALVHQLSFAMDGQINWLRERTVAYIPASVKMPM